MWPAFSAPNRRLTRCKSRSTISPAACRAAARPTGLGGRCERVTLRSGLASVPAPCRDRCVDEPADVGRRALATVVVAKAELRHLRVVELARRARVRRKPAALARKPPALLGRGIRRRARAILKWTFASD